MNNNNESKKKTGESIDFRIHKQIFYRQSFEEWKKGNRKKSEKT